jgi:hypothetical protein
MARTTFTAPVSDAPDTLVPDAEVCREFGVTSMSLWRWDHDLDLNFPPPIRLRKRKFRSRRQLDAFKSALIADAIAGRNSGEAA